MTEREAWTALAEAIEGSPPDDRFIFCGRWYFGLCGAIASLLWHDLITDEVWHSMRTKIYRLPGIEGSSYRWPLGDHKSRAAFCRQAAKEAE